jgi:hypothetical protein
MPTRDQLRRKYPKWAHRRAHKRRRRRKQRAAKATTTETMLVSLLQQLMLGAPKRKHGENVVTGYLDRVRPDSLAPVRSRAYHRMMQRRREPGFDGASAGASAALYAPTGIGEVQGFTTHRARRDDEKTYDPDA